MTQRVDLYSSYGRFTDPVLDAVRKETFGTDIGQNSWVTVEEFERWLPWLGVSAASHVLEVASGSGGSAVWLAGRTGCRVTGIDVNEGGVANARETAARAGSGGGGDRVSFLVADANAVLPFDDGTFDAIVCIDSVNHFPDRALVLREWRRVLRPGGRALFTDPVVVTGMVTNEELAARASIGVFVFVPPGVNERLIEGAGFGLLRMEDASENAAIVAARWGRARRAHREELVRMEGEARFEGLQEFFGAVERLTGERRLSRMMYVVERRAG